MPSKQRPGDVFTGLADLLGQRRHVRPAVIRPQHAHHRRHHPRENRAAAGCTRPDGGHVRKLALAEQERQCHQDRDAPEFQDRADDLQRSPAPGSEHVHCGHHCDRQHRGTRLPDLAANRGGGRAKLHEITSERGGQRRHRPRPDHQELDPAKQERQHRPVRRSQIHVKAAGLRHHRAQLGKRQGTRAAQDAAEHPHQDDAAEEGNVVGDLRRDQEDGRADRAADHHAERVDRHPALAASSPCGERHIRQGSCGVLPGDRLVRDVSLLPARHGLGTRTRGLEAPSEPC